MGASKKVLLGVNVLAVVISLVILGLTLWVMYGQGTGVAELDALPIQIYYAAIGFSLLIFFISVLGVIGGCLRSKAATILFVILDILTIIFVLVVTILLLLYSNGITTTETVDNGVRAMQLQLQENLLTQALQHEDVCVTTQDGFVCCGIDFNTTYQYADYDMNQTEFLSQLHPGQECAAGVAAIVALQDEFPDYNATAQLAANENAALGPKWFCKNVVSSFVVAQTQNIGIIAGVLVFIQIITCAAAIILLTKTTINSGGFIVPKDQQTGAGLAYGEKPHGGPETNTLASGNVLA